MRKLTVPDIHYLPREMTRQVERALEVMPVVVLTGMRQVGKTTLLRRGAAFAERSMVTMDDFSEQQAARSQPTRLLGEAEHITIDEAQKVPELIDAVKLLVDEDRRPGRFLLSGSANLELLEAVSESLAGRAVYLHLRPLSLRERSERAKEPFLVQLIQEGTLPPMSDEHSLADAAFYEGGMPSVVAHGAASDIWFRGFVQTYLERDVRDLANVGDLVTFRTFLGLVALRTGSLLNVSDIARDAKVSFATATRYLSILESSFSLFRVPPYLKSRVSRLVKGSKIYMADAGLADHLIGFRGPRSPSTDTYQGQLLETFVLQNLVAILEAWLPDATISFWNVQGRYEVDFVIELGQVTLAIEVKLASRWSKRDIRGLEHFLATTPTCMAGILACQTDHIVPLGDKLWAVPLGTLLS